MRRLKVFDGCTQYASETAAFKDRGHEVITLGIDGDVDIKCDIRQYYPSVDDKYDFMTFHPPCEQFSIAKGIACRDRIVNLSVVEACFRIVETCKPTYWIIENPRGCLRYFIGKPQATIKYGDYGYQTLKPTDLWGVFPFFYSETKRTPTQNLRIAFSNQRKYWRSHIPYGLSLALCKAIERDITF